MAYLHLRVLALRLRGLVDRVDDRLADLPGLRLEQHAHDGIVFVLRQLDHDAAEVRAGALVRLLVLHHDFRREDAWRAVDAHDLADRTLRGRHVDGAEVEVGRELVRDRAAYRLSTCRSAVSPIVAVTSAGRRRGSGCSSHVAGALCGRRRTW